MNNSIHKQAIFLKLNQCSTVASFFAISTSEITVATNELAHSIFLSDLFPVPLVGTFLNTDDGPMEETIVKLRVLTNLGHISDQDLEDITTIFALSRKYQHPKHNIEFNDTALFSVLSDMHIVKELNLMNFPLIDKELSLNENFYLESVEHQKREIQHDLSKSILALAERLNS